MFRTNLKPIAVAWVYASVGIVLQLITARAPEPQDTHSLLLAAPTFAIAILFIAAILTIGLWIIDRLQIQTAEKSNLSTLFIALGAGSTALYLLVYGLLALRLFSSQHSLLLWLVLALPFAAKHRELRALIAPTRRFKKSDLFHCIPALLIFLRGLESLQIHRHGDAYIAYLNASRAIGSDGNFSLMLELPQLFVVTSWETLYSWGTALMGLRGGAGLDLSQYFAQWCSSLIACSGIVLGIYSLGTLLLSSASDSALRVSKFVIPLAATLALQTAPLRWTANLAKHDLGVAFWAILGFFLSLFAKPSLGSGLLAGLMIGAAVIGKLPLIIFGFVLYGVIAIRAPRMLWAAIVGGLLGVAPILLRNFILTHNPMFPWLSNWFPASGRLLSPTLLEGMLKPTQNAFALGQQGHYLLEFIVQAPWTVGAIIIVAAMLFQSKHFSERLSVWSIPIGVVSLSILGFNFVFRTGTEIRYQNVTLILMTALGILGAARVFIMTTAAIRPILQKRVTALFAILLLAATNLPFFSLFQIGTSKYAPISTRLIELNGGAGKLWIRQNVQAQETVLSLGDPLLYYVQDKKVIELVQNPEWNQKFLTLPFSDFTQSICNSSIQYLYVATDLDIWQLHGKGVEYFQFLTGLKNKECAQLNLKQHQVWNIPCLCQNSPPH